MERARGTDTKVIFQDEAWTSKTCGKCGHIKMDLGGNKQYDCEKCGLSIDRDVNGAKNIFAKALM